jgi:Tfp pilus assembly protein PilN
LNLLPASHLVSTHIRGKGHALFQVREQKLELRRRSPDELTVDGNWINRTGLVAEGLASQPYLHLDIRTPFGESVDGSQVAEALAEALGPKRERYRLGGWHVQFVEDTNLGSNHRVFVDLIDGERGGAAQAGMDAGISLELAMEALGEMVAAEKGEANFQLLYGGKDFCYSLLYVSGSPFHVLRVPEGAGPKALARLKRHREFAGGRTGPGRLRAFLSKGDPLWEFPDSGDLKPEAFALAAAPEGGEALLHLGLAAAARQRDFASHNRVPSEARRRNESVRTRFRFYLALTASAVAMALAAAAFGMAIRYSERQAGELRAQASAYQAQVDAIRALRIRKARLEASIADLKPIWRGQADWSAAFSDLAKALPKEAGIDGFTATREPDGGLEISFKAWVRDWDQVQAIQKRLSAGGRFASVSLSEQRKDLATGVVVFHVTARMGGG